MIFKYLKIKLKKKFIINYKKFKKFEINLKIITDKSKKKFFILYYLNFILFYTYFYLNIFLN